MIVDNASVDGTVRWIEEHYPQFHMLRNTRNVGYCRAHNQALRLTSSDYVLVLNPDVVLVGDWLQQAMTYLDAHEKAGSFGGKLLRFSYTSDELKEMVISPIIDSAGLQVNRNRHTVDRGSGQPDTGQFDSAEAIFGFSGACVMYRRSALDSVRWRDEFFDNDIFAYKDDLDISWRLQRMGWTAWYEPQAIAYHYRSIKGTSQTSDLLVARNYRSRSRFNSYYSYRNHWLVLFKNETWSTVWRDLPWIVIYEVKKFVFLTFTGRPSVAALISAFRLRTAMRKKAALMKHQSKRSALEVRQWFIQSSS